MPTLISYVILVSSLIFLCNTFCIFASTLNHTELMLGALDTHSTLAFSAQSLGGPWQPFSLAQGPSLCKGREPTAARTLSPFRLVGH